MHTLRLGLLALLLMLPLASPLPVSTEPDVWVNGARLSGPDLVEAGVPTTYTGSFRTGALGASTVALDHRGDTVWLEVDGARVASTTVANDGTFRFTVPLERGHRVLRAVAELDPSSPGVSTDEHRVNVAARPSAPLGFAAGPAVYWDDVRLQWQPPADDGGAPVTYYVWTASPAPRSREATSTAGVTMRLVPGVTYTFTASACSRLACGAPTEPLTYTLPPPTPIDAISVDV